MAVDTETRVCDQKYLLKVTIHLKTNTYEELEILDEIIETIYNDGRSEFDSSCIDYFIQFQYFNILKIEQLRFELNKYKYIYELELSTTTLIELISKITL